MKPKKEDKTKEMRPVGREWGYVEDSEMWAGPMTDEERERWHHIRQGTAQIAFVQLDILDNVQPGENIKPQRRQAIKRAKQSKKQAKTTKSKSKSKASERAQAWLNHELEKAARNHNIDLWKPSTIRVTLAAPTN